MRRTRFPLHWLIVLAGLLLAGNGCEEEGDVEVEERPPVVSPTSPPTTDGIDNDGDGFIDEPDEAEAADGAANGAADEEDAGPTADPTVDGVDNDGDGTIDEPDEAEA